MNALNDSLEAACFYCTVPGMYFVSVHPCPAALCTYVQYINVFNPFPFRHWTETRKAKGIAFGRVLKTIVVTADSNP